MTSKFEIKPFPVDHTELDPRFNHIDTDYFPLPPFRAVVVGPSGGRKTSLMFSLLNSKQAYKNVFDMIIIFTPSVDENEGYAKLNTSKTTVQVINKFTLKEIEDYYNTLVQAQQARKNKDKSLFNYLFIFDDLASSGISKKHSVNILDTIYFNGRHSNISCFFATQSYTAINQNMRCLNVHLVAVLPSVNLKDLKKIAEEHAGNRTPEEFITLFNKCAQDKQPLIINYKNSFDKRLNKGFNEIL